MYDANKIAVGLLVFVGFFTYPIWRNLGQAGPVPEPKKDTPVIQQLADKKCVENTAFMKANHPSFLNEWRDTAVRKDVREYVGLAGKKYEISLQNTCMKCHSNKEQFCDKCHVYAGIKPYCWNCHVEPKKEPKESM